MNLLDWLRSLFGGGTPTPAPTPTPPPAVGAGPLQQLATLTNTFRRQNGLAVLAPDPRLTAAAQSHSGDQQAHGRLSHVGSDGADLGARLVRAGYSWSACGECIAWGQQTPEQVLAAWEGDPPHRAILLDPSVTQLGVGKAGVYWVLDVARPA